jgi:hypothetical protein
MKKRKFGIRKLIIILLAVLLCGSIGMAQAESEHEPRYVVIQSLDTRGDGTCQFILDEETNAIYLLRVFDLFDGNFTVFVIRKGNDEADI